jgi:hypothetical protein
MGYNYLRNYIHAMCLAVYLTCVLFWYIVTNWDHGML